MLSGCPWRGVRNPGLTLLAGAILVLTPDLGMGQVRGRLGTIRSSESAAEPATRPVTGTDLSSRGGVDGVGNDYIIVNPPGSRNATQPYSEVEYGRIIRSLMKIGGIPLAINYQPGQTILPEGFEKSVLQNPGKVKPIRVKAIDLLDRGVLLMPTRETVRLRGSRIPSQFSGSEAARGAGREAMRVLRDIIRAGDLELVPGFPVRDSSGAILVDVELQDGSTLSHFLIREGLAMTESGDYDTLNGSTAEELNQLQSQARRSRVGLWGRR